MTGVEQRTQASGYRTWNLYLQDDGILKFLFWSMRRRGVDLDFLSHHSWGEANCSLAHIIRCVFVVMIAEGTVVNAKAIRDLPKCLFGKFRMVYWNLANPAAPAVTLVRCKRATKAILMETRRRDANTARFFRLAKFSGKPVAGGSFQIIGGGPIDFDPILFGPHRWVRVSSQSTVAHDCHPNGVLKVNNLGAFESSNRKCCALFREIHDVVATYYHHYPNRLAAKKGETNKDVAERATGYFISKLRGSPREFAVQIWSVSLVPGSFGFVFNLSTEGQLLGSGKKMVKT